MRRDVFQAIADPTRRKILNVLAHESLNLNSVAEKFHSSRPAISKHIKILTECGLIRIRQQGRERYCEAKLQKLNEVSEWIERYRVFWTKKLDALESFLDSGSGTIKKISLHVGKKRVANVTNKNNFKKKQKSRFK